MGFRRLNGRYLIYSEKRFWEAKGVLVRALRLFIVFGPLRLLLPSSRAAGGKTEVVQEVLCGAEMNY